LIATNPQFTTANYYSNAGNNNYHSFQAEIGLRPTHGFSGTANYTFSKNLGLPCAACSPTTFANPVNREADYSIVNMSHPHVFRMNGNIELPIGPGKALFRNSSGTFARIIEGWRFGSIWTASSGAWTNITAQNTLYANGVPDIADPALLKELLNDAKVNWGAPTGSNGFLEGRYFDPAKWTKVPDPQCAAVTNLQNFNTGANRCVLQAVAKVVDPSTPNSFPLNDSNYPGKNGVIVLKNPQPGQQGNLGFSVLRGLPVWRFDSNISKAFRITETKNIQLRVDAFNVLNHPQPGNPNLSINPTLTAGTTFGANIPWGQITTKTGGRILQGQLRLEF
jgi:hypothetical protein